MKLHAVLRRAASAAIVMAGAFALVMIVYTSLDSEQYFYYSFQDRSTWEWPILGVVIFALITLAETLAAYLVFRLASPRRVWQRALLVLAVPCPWAGCQMLVIVHSPGFFMFHIVWVWFLLAFLALAALVSAAGQAYEKFVPVHREQTKGSV